MSYSNTFIILGKTCTIEINNRGNHCHICLNDMVITDASGEIGFWEGFNSTKGSRQKGAAYYSALNKYAREFCESEIVAKLEFMEQQIREAA